MKKTENQTGYLTCWCSVGNDLPDVGNDPEGDSRIKETIGACFARFTGVLPSFPEKQKVESNGTRTIPGKKQGWISAPFCGLQAPGFHCGSIGCYEGLGSVVQ